MSTITATRRRTRPAFTLTELLVVIGVIAVLSVLTLVSVRAVTRDARLSSAANSVIAALDNARALAMKTNRPVMVAFYPVRQSDTISRVHVVTTVWTGDSFRARVQYPAIAQPVYSVFDRFQLLSDVRIRELPRGIKVGGPSYLDGRDDRWLVMTEVTRANEAPGQLVGVMYGPDGTTLTSNPASDSDFFWIDFNRSEDLEMDLDADGEVDPQNAADHVFPAGTTPVPVSSFLLLRHPEDEVAITLVPFLAVFDDTAAREIYDSTSWNDPLVRDSDLSEFLEERATRVHFNRYTGVAMQ